MYESMHARLQAIADADSDREERLGVRCPIRLDFWLVGGHEAVNFSLSDGENSLDDQSIDLRHRTLDMNEVGAQRTIAIEHIVMFAETWPTEAEESAAAAAVSTKVAA